MWQFECCFDPVKCGGPRGLANPGYTSVTQHVPVAARPGGCVIRSSMISITFSYTM